MCVDVYIWLHFCVHLITPLFFFNIVLLLRCNIELYWISFLVLSLYPNESSSVLHINETLLCDEKELLKTLMSQISTHSAISRELHSAALWTGTVQKKRNSSESSLSSVLCVRAVVILNIWNHERVLSSSSQVKSQLFHLNMMLSSHKWLICNNLMLWLWHPEQNMITVYYVQSEQLDQQPPKKSCYLSNSSVIFCRGITAQRFNPITDHHQDPSRIERADLISFM